MNCAVFALLLIIVGLHFSELKAQQWEYSYLQAENEGELSICVASINYSDGPFAVRVYSDVMDFYLADDELSLPSGQLLGNVLFRFKGGDFTLPAHSGQDGSNAVSHMFITPDQSDYVDMLQSLRYSETFDIVFPDGLSYTIDLAGSNDALLKAFECWSQNSTGQGGRNPFAQSGGRNPFQ